MPDSCPDVRPEKGGGRPHAGSPSRQGLLIDKDPEGSTDGPRAGACEAPADDAPSQDELHFPCPVALEGDDPRTQGGRKKRPENPATGKDPVAGVDDIGRRVIASAERADASDRQAPRRSTRNGDRPAVSFRGHGAADEALLPHLPRIPARIRIPSRPDTFGPFEDDTVHNSLLLAVREEDDDVAPPQLLDTAGDEHNPVPRTKEGPHAVAPHEQGRSCISRRAHGHGPLSPVFAPGRHPQP